MRITKLVFVGLLLLIGVYGRDISIFAQDITSEPPNFIVEAIFDPTGDLLLVNGRAGTTEYQWGIWLYDANLSFIHMFPTQDQVSSDWSPDGSRFSMGRSIVDVETRTTQVTLVDANSGIGGWSPDGGQVLAWFDESNLGFYDSITGRLVRTIPVGEMTPDAVSWSPNGIYIALVQPDGQTDVMSSENGEHIITLPPLQDMLGPRYPLGLRWSLNSEYLAAGFTENVGPGTPGTMPDSANPRTASVIIWELNTGVIIQRLSGLQDVPRPIRWNPARPEELAGAFPDGLVHVWNISTGQLVDSMYTLPGLTTIEYSPLGGRMVVGAWADQQVYYEERVESAGFSQNIIANVLEIFVPAPSPERLQAITDACGLQPAADTALTAEISAQDYTGFTTQLEALPDDALPPGCRADLLAVAAALEGQ